MDLSNITVPVFGFCAACSGTGKTTLLKKLIPLFRGSGLRVGLIKHAHHGFDLDQPGKDSYELRRAGADAVLVASSARWALMRETPEPQRCPGLFELLSRLGGEELELILVEGFKQEDFPKLELHRPSLGRPLLHPEVPGVVAVATDVPEQLSLQLPVLDLNQPEKIAEFILDFLRRRPPSQEGSGDF